MGPRVHVDAQAVRAGGVVRRFWRPHRADSLRIDAIYFASFDQGCNDRAVITTAVGAGEQMVLAAERDGADGALDDV